MNHYNLISKLKLYPKQSFPGGVDNDPDTVYNNPGSTSIPASRDQETVGNQLPSRSPSSDTPLGDTGNGRIPTTEAPLKSPNDLWLPWKSSSIQFVVIFILKLIT